MNSDELKVLVDAGIIDQEKAEQISTFLDQRAEEQPSRIFLVFAILGAILIGVGIFSIMAFNWSSFSKITKTVIAFAPLIIAQGLCFYTLLKKDDNPVWYESVSTLLVFAFGGALILLSEIYPINKFDEQYLLIWILFSIALIFIMRSSMASLLSMIGIMIFTFESNANRMSFQQFYFIPLFIGIAPHYFNLLKNRSASNFTLAHHFVFWLCLLACVCSMSDKFGNMIPFAFLFMGNLTLLLSHQKLFLRNPLDDKNNVLYYLSILGIFIAVVFYSFHDYWDGYLFKRYIEYNFFTHPLFFSFVCLSLISLGIIIKEKLFNIISTPLFYIFIPALLALLIGKAFPIVAVIIFNIIGFLMGLFFVLEGNHKNHLGILNIGLVMILILIFSRAMDLDINNAWKGVLFVILGLGFFLANFIMIKKRKTL